MGKNGQTNDFWEDVSTSPDIQWTRDQHFMSLYLNFLLWVHKEIWNRLVVQLYLPSLETISFILTNCLGKPMKI